jgi:hypothetical protein
MEVGRVGVAHLKTGDQQGDRDGAKDGERSEGLGAELAPGQPDHRASPLAEAGVPYRELWLTPAPRSM